MNFEPSFHINEKGKEINMGNTPASQEEHLVMVGKLVQNAAITESLMFTAFKILSGCPLNIARAIFYTLDSFPARKPLLKGIS